jgi:hypothetical protein
MPAVGAGVVPGFGFVSGFGVDVGVGVLGTSGVAVAVGVAVGVGSMVSAQPTISTEGMTAVISISLDLVNNICLRFRFDLIPPDLSNFSRPSNVNSMLIRRYGRWSELDSITFPHKPCEVPSASDRSFTTRPKGSVSRLARR